MVERRNPFPVKLILLFLSGAVIVCLGGASGRGQNRISANTSLTTEDAPSKAQGKSTFDDTFELQADFEKKEVGARQGQVNNSRIATPGGNFSSAGRTLGSLLIVLALIVGASYLFRRRVLGGRGGAGPAGIEVLARNSINPKQSLCLVKLGGRVLLLGLSPNQMTALHTIDDPEEVAEVLGLLEQNRSQSIGNTFGKLLHQEGQNYNEEEISKGDEGEFLQEPNQQWYQAKGELSSLLDKVKGMARMRFRH